MKMLLKLIALTVVFGAVLAEPVAKLSSATPDDLDLSVFAQPMPEDHSNQQLQRLIPEGTFLLLDVINALAGYKFTAISLGVVVIEWVIKNALIIVFGAAAALGLCKITGKCNLNYESYIPVAQLKTFVTPEYLDTAQKFFVSAVEKYAEKKARAAESRPWFY